MRTLWLAVVLWPLAGCRLAIEPDITYRDCDRSSYVDPFTPGTELEALFERCWQLDNTASEPDVVFPDDGDLVIRVRTSDQTTHTWVGADQAPFFFQRIAGDFVAATRVEAVHQVSGDHCLAEGNVAGIAVRYDEDPTVWSTLLIGPDNPNQMLDCTDEATPPPPTQALLQNVDDRFGEAVLVQQTDDPGLGEDGEADLAVCRVGGVLTYFYRDRTIDPMLTPVWPTIAEHDIGADPLHVGLTSAGADGVFEVEGHFNWAFFQEGIGADGCRDALEQIPIPEDE